MKNGSGHSELVAIGTQADAIENLVDMFLLIKSLFIVLIRQIDAHVRQYLVEVSLVCQRIYDGCLLLLLLHLFFL